LVIIKFLFPSECALTCHFTHQLTVFFICAAGSGREDSEALVGNSRERWNLLFNKKKYHQRKQNHKNGVSVTVKSLLDWLCWSL